MVDFRQQYAKFCAERDGTSVEAELTELARLDQIRALHDGYLPTEGVPFLRATGHHSTRGEIRLLFEIQSRPSEYAETDKVLTLVEGCVTGYEAFRLEDRFFDRGHRAGQPFYLCAGGMGWPSLQMESAEADRVLAWARSAAPLRNKRYGKQPGFNGENGRERQEAQEPPASRTDAATLQINLQWRDTQMRATTTVPREGNRFVKQATDNQRKALRRMATQLHRQGVISDGHRANIFISTAATRKPSRAEASREITRLGRMARQAREKAAN